MEHTRVIPRDLFNEAKLLKCIGQLALKIHDRMAPEGVEIEENGEPFQVELMQEGSLRIANYRTSIHNTACIFKTTYNSRYPYPLHVEIDNEEWPVFNDDGSFTGEFLELCNKLKK